MTLEVVHRHEKLAQNRFEFRRMAPISEARFWSVCQGPNINHELSQRWLLFQPLIINTNSTFNISDQLEIEKCQLTHPALPLEAVLGDGNVTYFRFCITNFTKLVLSFVHVSLRTFHNVTARAKTEIENYACTEKF